MKIFLTLFLFALLSACSVASLVSTAFSTAAKVIEFPIKAIGKAVTRDNEEEEEGN